MDAVRGKAASIPGVGHNSSTPRRKTSRRMRLLSNILADPYSDDFVKAICHGDIGESQTTPRKRRRYVYQRGLAEPAGPNDATLGSLGNAMSVPNETDMNCVGISVQNIKKRKRKQIPDRGEPTGHMPSSNMVNNVGAKINIRGSVGIDNDATGDMPNSNMVNNFGTKITICDSVGVETDIEGSHTIVTRARKRKRTQIMNQTGQLEIRTFDLQSSSGGRLSGRLGNLPIINSGHTSLFKGLEIPATSDVFSRSRNCAHCDAVRFKFESKNFCCLSGRVKLHIAEPLPNLYELYVGSSALSDNFRKYVRIYNSSFAFTSMGVHLDQRLMRENAGIYTFRIQGQVHHSIRPLDPGDHMPAALQLYFHDTEHELQNRLQFSTYLIPDVVQLISSIMVNNPYATFFRSLRDLDSLQQCTVSIAIDPVLDQRVFNAPTVSQVAAMWVEDGAMGDNFERDIVVHGMDNKSYPIYYNYGCYDALQYPLLFPRGEVGWHPQINRMNSRETPIIGDNETIEHFLQNQCRGQQDVNARKRVTCRDYYCYKFQIRPGQKNIMLNSGRLFQQFVVDMYVKIETARLQYLKNNQQQIRADLYQGLLDSVQTGHVQGRDAGKRVILPASFIGGPRDMRKRYLDAMALVRTYGKPDLFVTITCNPNWPEIQSELEPYELAQNRPDLTSRIFRAKLEQLKKKIIDKSFFGPVAAYVYVVEFQKRGLPHAHFLIILKNPYKIVSPEQVDKFVCAEIPCSREHPYLHELVIKHMMHGPCGALNPNNVCMNKHGLCKNSFPKDFIDETKFGDDSFPFYKRSSNGPSVIVRRRELNNQWVVPYNPPLLAEFNCHLNVEVCSSIRAVKYLYKYVYKGHDRVRFHVEHDSLENEVNEISEYQDARWISPPEAIWRIYSFSLNEMYPHVYTLQVHLPGYHHVSFSESTNLDRLLMVDTTAKSMLTEYFSLNQMSFTARSLLYKQIPEKFVWDRTNKLWVKRKQKLVIGRMMAVGPAEGERYFLRLLLSHVKGAISFEDLRTVDSVLCGTFREACMLRGFLQNDDHYSNCFEEASTYAMPSQLRHLFSIILAYCSPNDPKGIWLNFKKDMSADFLSRGFSMIHAEQSTLAELHHLLELLGKDINEFGLVDECIHVDLFDRTARIIHDERQIPISGDHLSAVDLLNTSQRIIFDKVMCCVTNKSSLLMFVDGPGGTGKTFLYSTLLAHVRNRGLIALATASSGVAASILPGGRTAHYRFKIPLNVCESMQCNIAKQSGLANLLISATIIIWDEAPMMHKFCVESVDRLMRDLTGSTLPFGGKIVLLSGDFRQVLPVIPRASRSDICKATLVNSYLWPLFHKQNLTHNMRAHDDSSYSEYLLRLGNGLEYTATKDIVCIPNDLLIPYNDPESSLRMLLNDVFPDLNQWAADCYTYINRVILTPKNDSVDAINNLLIDEFPGQVHTYYSYDEAIDTTEGTFDADFLNTLSLNGVPPHELKLKLNCPVILLRNLNSAAGLSNGTRLICRRFHANLIEAEVLDVQERAKTVLLPRIPFIPPESQQNPFSFKRTQFPVRLCFAMTINKAQGQTLDYVGLYLREPVFAHGQLYVAMSRVKNRKSIKILMPPSLTNLPNDHTKNIVYTDILDITSFP